MRSYLLLSLLMAFSVIGFSQTRTVTGTVIDETGVGVPFASLTEKGTSRGTSADGDGNFSITTRTGAVLVVTATGFGMAEVTVGSAPTLHIVLTRGEGQIIDEVVVTALGQTREKRSLGYATQSVNAERLSQAANTDLAGALQGKTSGVEIKPSSGMPGASSLIVIRGARSFTGDNTPLYVIDGMPVSSGVDMSTGNSVTGTDYSNRSVDIDPNDIANIEILKGQAASALYGIRASNGVVLITTKSGKGAVKGKPQITFNTNTGFDRISRYPEVQTTYAQGSWSPPANAALYGPTSSSSWGPKITDLPNDPVYGGNTVNANTNRDGKHEGMYYVPQRANAGLDPWVKPNVYNNIRDFFLTGRTLNNAISLIQATDNFNYALALGSTNQKGIVPHTGMDRYNAKFAAEAKLSDHWRTSFTGNFINLGIDKMPQANDGIIATIYPAPSSYDLKGITDHFSGNEFRPNGYRGGTFVNPYWGTRNNSFNEKTNRFFGNANVTYSTPLAEGMKLDVKYQIGTDAYTTNYQDIWAFGSPNRTSSIEEYSYTNTTLNSLLTANLNWDINSDLHFAALYGNEISNTGTKYIYAYGANFAFGGWNHMNNTGTKDADEATWRYRNFGNFISLNFDYKRMLYLGATGRVDRVSQMPNGNRTFFYPSVSLGYVFTELAALKNNSTLNYGKLRLSYAQVGQAGRYLDNYFTRPAYGGGFYNLTPILYPIAGQNAYISNGTIYDPSLKPQNTISYEAGFDLQFFRNLIELSYTYSHQLVTDQIFDIPIATSTGAAAFRTNGGQIHTNAHEATLNVNVIRQNDMDWSIGANFSKIDNYVDKLADGVPSIFLGGFVTPQVRAGIGDKFPVIYGSSYQRDEATGKVVVGPNGVPLTGPPAVIGTVSPDFILGFNTSFRYKIATLAAVFDWKNGGQMYGGTTGLFGLYGMGKQTEIDRNRGYSLFENAVKEDGTPNDIKVEGMRAIQEYYGALNNIDESSIVNSSFLKMRELALRVQALKTQKLNIGVNLFLRNLLLWTNSPILDPESSQGNTNMGGAFERFTLPQTTTYGFGINVQF